MEKDTNIMPEFHISRVGHAIDVALDGLSRVLSPVHEAPAFMSSHYRPHGAAEALDVAVFDEPEFNTSGR